MEIELEDDSRSSVGSDTVNTEVDMVDSVSQVGGTTSGSDGEDLETVVDSRDERARPPPVDLSQQQQQQQQEVAPDFTPTPPPVAGAEAAVETTRDDDGVNMAKNKNGKKGGGKPRAKPKAGPKKKRNNGAAKERGKTYTAAQMKRLKGLMVRIMADM